MQRNYNRNKVHGQNQEAFWAFRYLANQIICHVYVKVVHKVGNPLTVFNIPENKLNTVSQTLHKRQLFLKVLFMDYT